MSGTKRLECQEVQVKIDVLETVRHRYTSNFEKMQSASSELLKAVQKDPNNGRSISTTYFKLHRAEYNNVDCRVFWLFMHHLLWTKVLGNRFITILRSV